MSTPPEPRPGRTSTVLAAVVGLAVAVLMLRQVAVPTVPVLMGIGGILSLTLCLWLVDTHPNGVKAFLVGLLLAPVALGFVGGLLGATLVLISGQFPVPTESGISVALLQVSGSLGVVTGCIVAVFGLTLGYRNVLAAKPLTRYSKIAFLTSLVPLGVGLTVFVRTAVAGDPRASESTFGNILDLISTVLFRPTSAHLHLASFLFVLTVASGAVVLFLRRAPVDELLESRRGMDALKQVTAVRRALYLTTVVSSILMVGAVIVEVAYSPPELRRLLGSGLYEFIQSFTTANWLRLLLVSLAVLAVGWLVLERILRQRETTGKEWLGPLAAGLILTGVTWWTAESVFDRILRETTTQLPDVFAAQFQDAIFPVVDVYGVTATMVLFAGILLGITAWIGLVCRVSVHFDYLSNEGAGFGIAGAGLLGTAISVVTTQPPSWLVFVGIAGAVVVWDLGRFGTRIGREVGSGTRSVELVHATGTVLVSVLAVGVAILLESQAAESAFRPSSTVALALVSLVVGIVAFSLALRRSPVQ